MQSKLTVHQDSVEECEGELGSSDDSSVNFELAQSLLQGKLYLSKKNILFNGFF